MGSGSDAKAASVHLPGLNGIRALASWGVIVFHVNQLREIFGFSKLDVFYFGPATTYLTAFLTLSGFLITYLLLLERRRTGTIAIRNFYSRRALRILPLYFVAVLLAFLVFPHLPPFQFPARGLQDHGEYWRAFLLYLCVSPHLPLPALAVYTTVNHLWTVGVETYFYLIWPLLVRRARSPLVWMVCTVVVVAALRQVNVVFHFVSDPVPILSPMVGFTARLADRLRLGCMAIGGIFAWANLCASPATLRVLNHRVTQGVVWGVFLFIQLAPIRSMPFEHEIFATIFGFIILNAATADRPLIRFESKFLHFAGERSYSFYVFHVPVILLTMYLLDRVMGVDLESRLGYWLHYGGAFVLTFAVSCVSYHFIERYFLRLRSRLAIVSTRG